jgi:hypothetical protein
MIKSRHFSYFFDVLPCLGWKQNQIFWIEFVRVLIDFRHFFSVAFLLNWIRSFSFLKTHKRRLFNSSFRLIYAPHSFLFRVLPFFYNAYTLQANTQSTHTHTHIYETSYFDHCNTNLEFQLGLSWNFINKNWLFIRADFTRKKSFNSKIIELNKIINLLPLALLKIVFFCCWRR